MLQGSMDRLGNSLLNERMIAERQKERGEDVAARNRGLDIEENRFKSQAMENTQRTWGDTVQMLGGWVKDGIVDPNVAQQKLQAQYEQMPDDAKASIAKHPATMAIQKGEPIWKSPTKRVPALTPAKIGGRDVVLSPEGAVHYADELSPVDREELRSVNAGLQQIQQKTQELATAPNPNAARALNAQRSILQGRKDDILKKYQTAPAADQTQDPDDGGDAGEPVQPTDAPPLPLPPSQNLLVTGKEYNTAHGVATWDGTQFVQKVLPRR